MKKILLFVAFTWAFIQAGTSQELVWGKGFGWFSARMATAVDAEGNLYLSGVNLGNNDIDPGPDVWTIPGPTNKSVAYVAKFDPSGQPLWVRSIGAPNADIQFNVSSGTGAPNNHHLKIGPDGHVHVLFTATSTDAGKLYVYPGPSDTILTTSGADMLVTFDPTGELVFTEVIWGNSVCRSTDFYVHSDGRVTVAGFFEGTIFPGSAFRMQTSAGQSDGFVYQYNPFNYNVLETRSRRIGGAQKDNCYGIAGDPSGNLLITGMFYGDCDVDPSDSESHWLFLQNGQLHNGYLLKCSADLEFGWAQRFQTGGVLPNRVATDAAGNAYVSTYMSEALVFRYSPGGALNNGYTIGAISLGAPALEFLQMRIDPAGNLHCWGAEPSLTNGNYDAVYRKIDTENAEVLSELRFPATTWSAGLSIAVDGLNNVFLTGNFQGTIDLDPGSGEQLYTAAAPYPQRLFWVKLNDQCPGLGVKFPEIQPVRCSEDGLARAVAFGTNAPYSYEWSTVPVQQDSVATFTQSGYVTLQITDAAGCIRRRNLWIDGVENTTPAFFDLEMRPIIATEFRPGFQTKIFISAANQGCHSVDGTIRLALDPALQFLSAMPPPDAIEGDTLIWQRNQWNFDQPFLSNIDVQLPAGVPLGSTVRLYGRVETDDEALLTNNEQVLESIVIGSFDPNDISASPPGVCEEQAILPVEKLTYTVRFQNTGTASAIRVRILDTLPAMLDLESLRILAHSHAISVERIDTNVLAFVFDDIFLPDSFSNEAASHGFVQFELALKNDVPLGTAVENRAAIYFDFNEPVITNTVSRTIADPLPECPIVSTRILASDLQFSIFPNPATAGSRLQIVLENDYYGPLKTEVFSINGRAIYSVFTIKNTQKHTVLLEDLPYLDSSSVQIIRVSDGRNSGSKRLTIIPANKP